MSNACIPILVGVIPPISEIWVPFKNGQISLLGHGLYIVHGPGKIQSIGIGSKNSCMQLGIDVKCIHTNFGGRGLSGFGDMGTLQKLPNFPFGAWTIVSAYTPILVGVVSPVSEIWVPFKNCQISLLGHGL